MSKTKELYALLLKSSHGYKEEAKGRNQLKAVAVHKGSLLIYLDSLTVNRVQEKHDRLVNYKVADRCDNPQSEAFLFADESTILCITTLQRDFLLGIKQTHYRMEVLERLQWVESLAVGSDVYVTIATIPTPVRGMIRYIGGLSGEEGRKFGIELREHRGEGTQNGEFKGQKYFKCDEDCAVFVAMDKITDRDAAKAAKVTSVSKPLARDSLSIKINDHVVFYNIRNELIRGTAKWIGTDKSSDDVIVGIEVQDDLSIADIPHRVNIGEAKEYFSSEKSKIFIPIIFVRPDASRSSDTQSGDAGSCSRSKNVHMPTKDGKISNPHNFVVGSAVQYLDTEQYGVIKWIGTLQGTKAPYAGVEMEDYVDTFGGSDGTWGNVRYFSCKPNKGKLVLLNSLKPDQRSKKHVLPEKSSQANSQSNDVDNRPNETVLSADNIQLVDTSLYNLEVGSVIQFGEPPRYGVIKWIGNLPDQAEVSAGLEMDNDVDEDAYDGVWAGVRYYHCKPKRGIFVYLSAVTLKFDRRTMRAFEDKSTKLPKELNITENTSLAFSSQNPHNFTLGCTVQYGGPRECGVIKWIGTFPYDKRTVYAGLIVDGWIEGGANDGVWNGTRYYDCEPKRGTFVPLLYLKPCNERKRKGDMLSIYTDEANTTERRSLILKQFSVDSTLSPVPMQLDQNPYKFEVGSTVQYGKPVEHGVIKWIGFLPGKESILCAGVEMEKVVSKYTDGKYRNVQYFESRAGRGKFVRMLALQPDKRFEDVTTPQQVFKIGSRVQFGRPKEYGVIKWIGMIPGSDEQHVRVEMGDNRESGFIPFCKIQLDSRYGDNSSLLNEVGESDKSNTSISASQQVQLMLEVGSAVQFGDPVQYGIIKKIERDPVSHKEIAEVEMDDGVHFSVSLSEVKPDGRFNNDPNTKNSIKEKPVDVPHVVPHPPVSQVLEVGSMVQFGNPVQYGVIKVIRKETYSSSKFAEIETEDHKYKAMPLVELLPDSRFTSNIQHVQEGSSNSQHVSTKLENGSLVQFGNPVQYGVIKRIETAIDTLQEIAEVETENNQLKKIPLAELQPDNRFIIDVNKTEGNTNPLEKEYYTHEETLFPVPPADKFDAVKHTDIKGIQGYKNSCYLDATLYGMFNFSDAFDILILEKATTNAEELDLQKRLKCEIVYPLRKKGIVIQKPIEEFREHLAELQNMKGLTSEEKDPEEFLNILFKHVLHLDPFITIRRPSGTDKEFFVQLFVEPDKDEPAVNTERLLSKMFQEQNISFAEYPTRLLLQMPRYGKRFKSFQRIIPSLELNITPLCMTTGLCSICQHRMGYVCNDCSNQKNQLQVYCSTCSPPWHQNFCDHNHELYNDFDTGTLQLLSVLCIETSHYVCFTRITGSGKDEWVFFDSMAERQDNGYNLPKVIHCTNQLQEYVYGEKDIANIPSKSLPELVRRFVEDAYLCIYIDHDGVMYQ